MGSWERNHYEVPPVCVICGRVLEGNVRGTIDHYIPFCVTGSEAERKEGVKHPLLTVVRDPNNLYRICTEEEHSELDREKTGAFLGYNPEDDVRSYLAKIALPGTMRGDPVALIQFLRENYPITNKGRYRRVQIRRMVTINNLFKRVALSLNGELDPALKERYQEAASLVPPFNRYLNSLR